MREIRQIDMNQNDTEKSSARALGIQPVASMAPAKQLPFDIARRRPKVLLIVSKFQNLLRLEYLPKPVGVSSLAACLHNPEFLRKFIAQGLTPEKRKDLALEEPYTLPDISVAILDPNLAELDKDFDFAVFLKDFNPCIVGVSSMSTEITSAIDIARTVREIFPDAVRVIGGPHASAQPEAILQDSEFQVAVVGEGEETFTELVLTIARAGRIDFSSIEGISFKNAGGDVMSTRHSRCPQMHLDDYPFSSDAAPLYVYKEYPFEKHGAESIYTTRGCPYGCRYCASRKIFRKPMRTKSPERVVAEIDRLHGRGFRLIFFADDTHTLQRDHALAIARLVVQKGLNVRLVFMTRADRLDEDLLDELQKAGVCRIDLGVESGDEKLMRWAKKDEHLTLAQVEQARDLLRIHKISAMFYMMVGLPDQDWPSLLESAKFLCKTRPPQARIFIALPLPGTDLYDDPRIEYRETHRYERYRTFRTASNVMTTSEIKYAQYLLQSLHEAIRQPARLGIGRILQRIRVTAVADKMISAQDGMNWQKREQTIQSLMRIPSDRFLFPIAKILDEKHVDGLLETAKGQWFPDSAPAAEFPRFLDLDADSYLDDFLIAVRFVNGFAALRELKTDVAAKWIILNACLWHLSGKKIRSVGFGKDSEACGECLNAVLGNVTGEQVTQWFEESRDEVSRCLSECNQPFECLGIPFAHHAGEGLLMAFPEFAGPEPIPTHPHHG
jgi:anaerobic magnesium-protoporphyrin IX monomethyl ester cyclase